MMHSNLHVQTFFWLLTELSLASAERQSHVYRGLHMEHINSNTTDRNSLIGKQSFIYMVGIS